VNRYHLLGALIAATALVSCATPQPQQSADESKPDKTYVTGSRLPVKESGSADVKSLQNKESIEEMMRNKGASPPKGLGM
jgi:hypothetical protein